MRKILTKHIFYPFFKKLEGLSYKRYWNEFQHDLDSQETGDVNTATDRIKNIIEYAYNNSPFYKQFYDKHGFVPDDFKTLDDLKSAPILEKSFLAEKMDAILSRNFNRKDLVLSATGGTTGNSFKFYYDRDCLIRRHALTLFANTQIGWHIGDPAAIVWNAHQDLTGMKGIKDRIKAALTDRSEIFDAQKIDEKKLQNWTQFLKKQAVEVLYGYAHSIHEIAKYILRNNLSGFRVRLVITTAEPLYETDRKVIEDAFECIVVSRYASREHGPMAQECSEGHMHYFGNSIFIENSGGDLLITDFWNKAVPFIRYRIGDSSEEPSANCTCGSQLPLLGNFSGRDTDFLLDQDGAMVSGMTLHEVYYNEADKTYGRSQINNIQFEQDQPNHITVRIVVGRNFNRVYEEQYIAQILRSIMGDNLFVSYEYVEHIPKTASGKYRFVINTIGLEG